MNRAPRPSQIEAHRSDLIADFNLVYTEHARRHLLSEGLPHRRIYLTGSPMKEVLDYYRPKIDGSQILEEVFSQQSGLDDQKSKIGNRKSKIENEYFLVSVHREENVDNPDNLQKILSILNTLAETYQIPVIVSTHPRTRKRLESVSSQRSAVSDHDSTAPLALCFR